MVEASPRASRRLDLEATARLTTVDSQGRPRASPVWFLRDGDGTLLHGLAGTASTRSLEGSAAVSHLDGDGLDGEVAIVEGRARVDPSAPCGDRNEPAVDEYGRIMTASGCTPEWLAERDPIAIGIDVVRVRAR